MKKIIIMGLMAMAAMTTTAQKFALIDMDYILKNIPAYERANEQLNQVSKLIRVIEHSVEKLTLPELEALYYDMTTKCYIND